ncbi:DivIVA domain-containing protein [Nocardia mexicana]|uniref:DivIVA domain-containing protein n=1 Tax=Nocardia mexicana TaxID=279262 RepID=A0A370H935_9NOCA|nr:DivIVA domain-containing protein [Nocardia mexicana]
MLTLLLYVLIVGLVAALLFLVASAVFGRGEELGPLPEGTTATVLPATGIHGGDVRSLRFQQVFRGYKTGEVDWALARLAARIDELETQLVQFRGEQPANGSTGAFPTQTAQTGPWTRTREWPTSHSATTQQQTPEQAWRGFPEDGGAPTAGHPPTPVTDQWPGPETTQPTHRPTTIPAVAPGTPPHGREPADREAQPPHTLNMSTTGHDGPQPTSNPGSEQSSHPTGPGSNPAVPGPNPAVPGSSPAIPGSNPSVPGSSPAIPGPNPAVPGSNASIPGPNPAIPEVQPPGAAGQDTK